jgi:hypothetical protein
VAPSVTQVDEARAALKALETAVAAEDFRGWDPYDALSSPLIAKVARTATLRQLATQALKNSPFNLRPLLGIRKTDHIKAQALFASGYARLAALGDEAAGEYARKLAFRLAARGIPSGSGLGWGYDFDVQTRWGYYRQGQSNSVVTAFAAHALLDVADLGEEDLRATAERALEFARSNLVVERGDSRFFAYFAGSKTPIHNANLLIASVFARFAKAQPAVLETARPAVEFSLRAQRADGSWPYGEGRTLRWVDGFHTAYVLRSLAWWDGLPGAPPVREGIRSGLDLYLNRLIDRDGAPRSTLTFRYPIDIHAAASAIWSLSELRDYDARALPVAGRVLDWTLQHLRRDDGRFAFQRRRALLNSVPYVRWNDGHMFLALASYLKENQA